MRNHVLISVLLLTTLACRPTLTIGWGEVLMLGIIIAVLLGPFILRVIRFWDEFRRRK